MRNAKYPEGLTKGEKANFRRKVNNNYKLDAGQLYYKKATDDGSDSSVWKMCIRSEEERMRVVKSCHEGVGGITATISNNCGAFSIAAAFHTALGDDVGVLTFDEAKLRPHLAECFELKEADILSHV